MIYSTVIFVLFFAILIVCLNYLLPSLRVRCSSCKEINYIRKVPEYCSCKSVLRYSDRVSDDAHFIE